MLFDAPPEEETKTMRSFAWKTGLVAVLVLAMGSVAYANSCGCSSAPLTTFAMDTARQIAPVPALAAKVKAAEAKVNMVLVEFSYQFNQDYAAMDAATKEGHYGTMVNLSAMRAQAVDQLADAYAGAQAPTAVLELLRGHAATLRLGPGERAAAIEKTERYLLDPMATGDYVMRQATRFYEQACQLVADSPEACVSRAIAAIGRDHDRHFDTFAVMAGPAAMLAKRLEQLRAGSKPVVLDEQRASLD